MKTELVQPLTATFESHAQKTDDGVEFWLARDLQSLLGYTKWDNFLNVVSKAKTASNSHYVGQTSGLPVAVPLAPQGCEYFVRRQIRVIPPYSLKMRIAARPLAKSLAIRFATILPMSGKWSIWGLGVRDRSTTSCSPGMPAT